MVGSLNADLVQSVERLPKPGETLTGDTLQTFPGGKGANQACATGRMGGRVSMVGQIGPDGLGQMLVENLRSSGVDTSHVATVEESTGAASIYVLPNGENAIVISPGANATLTPDEAKARCAQLGAEDILLCQMETPTETVQAVLEYAKEKGALTILDPAPADGFSLSLLPHASILTPNETEAMQLIESPDAPISSESDASGVARELRSRGASTVILKLGTQGCFVFTDDITCAIPAYDVEAVDTTAAGDTFNGAIAAKLAEGDTLVSAARFATAAAALTVTKIGAQSSIPNRAEVDELIGNTKVNAH